MKPRWRDFSNEKCAQSIAFGGGYPSYGVPYRAPRFVGTVLKRLLAEVPFGTSMPAVRRQAEQDFSERFSEWYYGLSPERQARFNEVFLQPGIWDPNKQRLIARIEFPTMPGGYTEQIAQAALMSTLPGRIKQFRPWMDELSSIRGLNTAELGHTARRMKEVGRRFGLSNKKILGMEALSPSNVNKYIEEEVRRLVDAATAHGEGGMAAMDSAFKGNRFVTDMDILKELAPREYKVVVDGLRGARPMPAYRQGRTSRRMYLRRDPDSFAYSYEAGADKFRYAKSLNDRVRGSDRWRDFVYGEDNLIPVEMEGGRFSAESASRIKNDIIKAIKSGEIQGAGFLDRLYLRMSKIKPGTGSGGGNAKVSRWPFIRPEVNLDVIDGPNGGKFVSRNMARHEFGHVFDLHGNLIGSAFRGLGPTPKSILSEELRANQRGGVLDAPGIDTYRINTLDPKEMLDVWKRYPQKKINLPK